VLWNGNYEDELVYPNPFKGQVQFDFNVKTPENISVQIVDASGRQVRQMMAPQNVQTGRYLMVWDGKNNEGAELPAGYYQLQIRGSHSGSRTKKLILNP